MSNLINPIIFMLLIGGIAGYFIGYLIKKLSHFALIIGIFVFLIMYLAYTKAVDLNSDELGATVNRFTGIFASLGLTALTSSVPFVGSFIVGLAIGLKRVN